MAGPVRRMVMGEENKCSKTMVHIMVIALSLTAFGFSIAAERRRSTGEIVRDPLNANVTFCVYDSDVATGYGVGAFLFLFTSQSLLTCVTKCMCFGRPLAPGGSSAWSFIYLVASWPSFMAASSCLIAGATKNAYHTKYRNVIYATNWTCESLRKGVFIAGAVFVVITMIFNVYHYMHFAKATSQAARKANRTRSTVGLTTEDI